MKAIYEIQKEVGQITLDGKIGVVEKKLKIELAALYPIEALVSPATDALDQMLDKLEAIIPGDWDKPMIEKFKVEYKEKLVSLLSE